MVPEVGQRIAEALAAVRTAALGSAGALADSSPERIVAMGPGNLAAPQDVTAGGTLRGFGPDIRAGGTRLVLPPSLTIAAWLLDEVEWAGPRTYATPADALSIIDTDDRIALLVMADGSARQRRLAPEWADLDGRAFDADVARALASGDADALASLDVDAAEEYGASGIDGLVQLGAMTKGARIAAHLRWEGAPLDVGYWVADWRINP